MNGQNRDEIKIGAEVEVVLTRRSMGLFVRMVL